MTERINSAVTALFADSSLLAKFKSDPEKALRSFDLLECELDAVKSGDEQALLAHGLDPQLVSGRTVTPHWFKGLLGTVSRRMAAPAVIAILLALAIQGSNVDTASASRTRNSARTQISRMRSKGPSGLRTVSTRASKRASVRLRTVRERVGARALRTYRVGLNRAVSQAGCGRCSSDGTK